MREMWCVASSPRWVQVRPASVDRNTPIPHGELWRFCGSPDPTHTTLGLDGARVTSPIDSIVWSSKTDSKLFPWLIVFHSPPVAVAT